MRFTRPKSTVAQAVLPIVAGLAFFAVLGLIAWGIAAWVSGSAGPDGNVQVNLGDETQKGGVRPGDLKRLLDELKDCSALGVGGLMAIPPARR